LIQFPVTKVFRGRLAVKATRKYDSSGRRTKAQQMRAEILTVARNLFLSHGYAATTVAAIAAAAGVSVETIYKTYGGKPGLVSAIVEQGLAGTGSVPAETRSNELHENEPDPVQIIRGWSRLSREVAPQVAPILLLVRDAAATDPAMARLRDSTDAQRLSRMIDNARRFAAGGHLRPGLSIETAGEIMWSYTSPALYEMLVIKRGWSMKRFGDFLADALVATLLPPHPAPPAR
jgi:AcrR family transcriptional regulator